jgi:hypothetical protein
MASTTSKIVPPFDFSAAEKLTVAERIDQSLAKARELVADLPELFYPYVYDAGVPEDELARYEAAISRPLPPEYRLFLSKCRYALIDDGMEIGGFDHEGISVTEWPWVSDEHRPGVDYLVFAKYWRYADGDQLMIDLSEPTFPVVAYLHEHGPLFELYAPSFSLAFWRLVNED